MWTETDSANNSSIESILDSYTKQFSDTLQVSAFPGKQLTDHPQTIAFVDLSVDDAMTLMADLQADIKVLLDPTQDGIAQITETLGHYKDLTSIDIISHGNVAQLQLGNSSLSANTLGQYAHQLQQWTTSLARDADVLFHGCNVAAGEVGQAFVNDLSTLTEADVAASTNLTGNSAQGGDWTLEYATGSIDISTPFTDSLMNSYQGLLASLFTTQTPSKTNLTDGTGSAGDYELGMEFRSGKAGTINSIRYYKATSETGIHTGKIWSSTGTLLASVTFTNETSGSGWQQQALATPLTIAANTTYVVSVNANSYYVVTNNGIGTTLTNGDISAVADGSNGVFNINPGSFPTQSYLNNNYFRDIDFTAFAPVNNTPGIINIASSIPNQVLTANVSDADGLAGVTINYQWQQSSNGTTWNNITGATNQLLLLDPTLVDQQLRVNASYVDVLGSSENVFSDPISISPSSPTQSLFTTQVPVLMNVTEGTGSKGDYELGMEFRSGKAGTINSIRYYKAPSEAGIHTGKIWSSTGTLLASVTFTNETSGSGWKQQALATPLTIAANTTYVVSVNANSYYVVTNNGIGTTLTNGDISAVADGSNGVFNINPGSFPTQSYLNSNYFRDIGFMPVAPNPNNNPGTVNITGTVTEDRTLTASITDPDEVTNPITYQWQQSADNGGTWSNITGAKAKTLTLGDSQVAKSIRVRANYVDALGTSETVFSEKTRPVVNINDIGLSILSGSATTTGTLRATILDNDGLTGSTINYRWQQLLGGSWSNIGGAIGQTFTLGSLFLDKQVRALATYTDAYNTFETVFSTGVTVAAFNPIVLENQKTGTTAWQITNLARNDEILGYGDATSINRGQALNLKVSLAQAGKYQIDVYRLGYYGGKGGRLVTSVTGLDGVVQSGPTTDPSTRLVEYNWNTSYRLQTNAAWTTGLYQVKLTDGRTGKQTYIPFVVRDDSRPSDIGFQDAVTTAQAYNNYGGYSVYDANSGGQRAYKVSFDRPYAATHLGLTNDDGFSNNTMLTWEYNMTRWVESQGYDVSYFTNLDVSTNPLQLYSQKTFLSVGHDEYWSMEQRNNVEKARDNGTNLSFFSANTAYWQVRFEPSSTGKANRVMTVYKDSSGIGRYGSIDPIAQTNPTAATTLFRNPEVNRPENSLMGVGYVGDTSSTYGGYDFVVSNDTDPYYANTGLRNGDKLRGLVGYEWDSLLNNGRAPAGLVVLSRSPVPSSGLGGLGLLPPGTNDTLSNSVRYTAASGAKVFSTGSIQWVWGLDSSGVTNPRVDARAQQIAVNVFADMGAKPQTPNAGIVVA